MADFLARESELLGGAFSPSGTTGAVGAGDTLDLDRAASAFPDIALDGSDDISSLPTRASALETDDTGFPSFDDFDAAVSAPAARDVKVTGGDELDRFENQFPDIDVDGAVRSARSPYKYHID